MWPKEITFSGLVLGSDVLAAVAQFAFLVLVSWIMIAYLVDRRIGSWDAIEIVSYPRLILGFVVCNAPFVGLYHLLLLIRPADNWVRVVLYVLASFIGYEGFSLFLCFLGDRIFGGQVIKVVTNRYKPGPQPDLVDLTAHGGRYARFIQRGTILASFVLLLLSLIVLGWGGVIAGIVLCLLVDVAARVERAFFGPGRRGSDDQWC